MVKIRAVLTNLEIGVFFFEVNLYLIDIKYAGNNCLNL